MFHVALSDHCSLCFVVRYFDSKLRLFSLCSEVCGIRCQSALLPFFVCMRHDSTRSVRTNILLSGSKRTPIFLSLTPSSISFRVSPCVVSARFSGALWLLVGNVLWMLLCFKNLVSLATKIHELLSKNNYIGRSQFGWQDVEEKAQKGAEGWKQSNPTTWNQARTIWFSAQSSVRCSPTEQKLEWHVASYNYSFCNHLPILRKWRRNDLDFFEQEQLNKIGVKKSPKSSAPHFPRYCSFELSLQIAVGTGKTQGRQTAQLKRCLLYQLS